MSTTEEKREGFYLSEDGEWVPEGWIHCTLRDTFDSPQDSLQTGPFGTALKASEYVDKGMGVPLISVREIREGKIELCEHTPYVCELVTNRLPQYILRKGDIVFGRKGAVERNSIVSDKETGWFLGSDGIRLRQSSNSSHYLAFWFQSPKFRTWVIQNAGGTTMASLNQRILERTPLYLPPFPEQKAIAALLSSLDDKIELLREQNETLEALAQTLFKRWFIDFNFPDKNGNPYKDSGGKMIPSEFGEIPEGWEVGSLNHFAEHVKNSVTPANSPDRSFNHFSIPAYDDGVKPVVENGEEIKSNKYEVIPRSILVSKLNPITPRIWQIQDVETNSVCSTEFQVLKPNTEHFGFVYSVLNSSPFRRELAGKARGTSSSHQRVSPADIFETEFVVSRSHEVETAYSETVDPLLLKVDQNRHQIQSLTKLRDTLLPKLMKGEIRVPVVE